MGDYYVYNYLNHLTISQLKKLAQEFKVSTKARNKHGLVLNLMHRDKQRAGGREESPEERTQRLARLKKFKPEDYYQEVCKGNEVTGEELQEGELKYTDPITGDQINESFVVILGQSCYNRESLKNWIDTFKTETTEPTDPLTRAKIEWSFLESLGYQKNDFPHTYGKVVQPQPVIQDDSLMTIRGHANPVTRVVISPDGLRGFSVSDDGTGHTGRVTSVAYSPDGRRIVSSSHDGTIRQWDSESGEQIGNSIRENYNVNYPGDLHRLINSIAYSPNGRRIVSGSEDGEIHQWNSESGEEIGRPLRGHNGSVTSVAYNPDGRRIVSGSEDYTIRQWDAKSGKQIGNPLQSRYDFVSASVYSVAYSPDGRRIVSGSADGKIHQWNSESGEEIGRPVQGHTRSVSSVAYSPDGRRIVSGGRDGTISQWDSESREQISIGDHRSPATSVAYSPDGRRIVSGSGNGEIHLLDAESGEYIGRPLQGHTHSVSSVAYSPDGRRIVSGSLDRTIKIWSANPDAVGGLEYEN